ncbi:MAG TPA: extracellular solute-binding protein [Actinomycetota bacterium]|nr:extracellular solute-binding protein [Actinomycetota bacterium]
MRKSAVALISFLALLASACGGGDGARRGGGGEGRLSGTSITFSISLSEEERAAIEDLLDQFRSDTGAEVKLTSVSSADLPPKLKVEVDAGRPTIHLFAQDNLALRSLVDQGLVEDLSDVQVPGQVVDSMVPEQFDGKTYFLPFRPNVRLAYANRDRFREAGATLPRTVEELRTTAEKLRSTARSGKVTLSLAEGDPAAVTISEWIVSFGGNPLILNDDGSVRAFEFLQGLWRDNLLARESLLGKFDTEVDNLQGETAWLAQNWPITSAQLAEQGLLNRFQVYEGWRGPAREAHVIGGDVLGIPKGVTGRQKEAAVALAEFLMSEQAQKLLVERNAWPSIREDAYGDVPREQKQTFDAIQAALENGWYRPNVAYWPDVSEQMNAAVRRVVTGGENARTVLDELHGRIEAAARQKGDEYPPAT